MDSTGKYIWLAQACSVEEMQRQITSALIPSLASISAAWKMTEHEKCNQNHQLENFVYWILFLFFVKIAIE